MFKHFDFLTTHFSLCLSTFLASFRLTWFQLYADKDSMTQMSF